ncbi:hypothetical protein HY632_04610 [Candidatus Uhrbacteria bacterium]|nr:hypothetical protein [Candidatus Uhrbacteria bacterium]
MSIPRPWWYRVVMPVSALTVLLAPAVSSAASLESAVSSRSGGSPWVVKADGSGNIALSLELPGITLNRLKEKDAGTPELLGAIVDPQSRRHLYISARVDANRQDGVSSGPFVAKIFRYDFEMGKLTRVHRESERSGIMSPGYLLLGFHGRKLLVVEAPYGDNSPGPCWFDEVLAGQRLSYIDVMRPGSGVRTFTPNAAFRSLRAKALATCQGSLN